MKKTLLVILLIVVVAFTLLACDAVDALNEAAKDGDAAHRPVQAMWHAHKDVPRFSIALCDERFQRFAQGFVARLVSLHDLPHPLVQNQQMIVFV